MRLYMIPTCPFVQRVLIACKIRGIPQSTLPLTEIDLSLPPKELLIINSSGSVPTLELEPGVGFHESLVITEFLDSIPAPGPKLYGSSPAETAMIRVLVETATSTLLAPLQQAIYSRGNLNAIKKSENALTQGFEWLEKTLSGKSGPFLGGSQLNAADVALAPFLARLHWFYEKHPHFTKAKPNSRAEHYIQSLTQCPEVAESLPTEQDMRLSTLRFLEPHPSLQSVIDAPRNLIGEPKTALTQAGKALSSWRIEHDGKGFCLKAKFAFKNHPDAIQKITWLHDAQETTDHHSSFVLQDFQSIEILLVTHEPQWGVTQKDVALAIAIQAYFTEGELQ